MEAYTLLTRSSERVFWLTDEAITWGDNSDQRMSFSGIKTIRRYDQLGLVGNIPSATACDLLAKTGGRLSLISNRAGLDRSVDFARFDAELRRCAAAYPQAGIWTGLPKAIWASYALWLLCTASMAIFCNLFVAMFAWAWLSSDPTRPPLIAMMVCALVGGVTGLNSVIIWRTLRRQWPCQQGSSRPNDAVLKRIGVIALLVVSAGIFSVATLVSIVSAVQWGARSPERPSMSLGWTFAITAMITAMSTRALWRVLRRNWIRKTAGPPALS